MFSGEIDTRIVTINDYFTFSLYANVCRSLFEKHKLLFAFLVCIRILLDKGDIDPDEYQFLLAGGVAKRVSCYKVQNYQILLKLKERS